MSITLTGQQLYELKWFCKNVAGVRQEYYSVFEKALAFDERIARLEKTCATIEEYFGEKLGPHESPFVDESRTPGTIAGKKEE